MKFNFKGELQYVSPVTAVVTFQHECCHCGKNSQLTLLHAGHVHLLWTKPKEANVWSDVYRGG